jgi:hypothetical protein
MKTAIVFLLMFLLGSTAVAGEPAPERRGFWGEILKGEVVILPSIKISPRVNVELKSANPRRGSIKILDGQVTIQTQEIRKEF